MKKLSLLIFITLLFAVTTPAYAATPDVITIIHKMKAAHESALEMAQKIEIQIKIDGESTSKWVAGKAQKVLPSGKHVLIVILEPEMLSGFAYLFKEKNDMTVDRWVYPPALRRIRKLVAQWNAYDTFLNTDFTYADLGFVDTKGEYKLLGEEMLDDTPTFKVQKIPESPIRYYSRIITWISKESYLPLRRDYYDIANRLYKRQLFEDVLSVKGTPIPYRITMTNLQTKSSTALVVKEVEINLALQDDIFNPERLMYSSTCPIWERVCYPKERINK